MNPAIHHPTDRVSHPSISNNLCAALHNAVLKSKENLTILCLKYLNSLLRTPPGRCFSNLEISAPTRWREDCMDAWKALGSECIPFLNVIAPD